MPTSLYLLDALAFATFLFSYFRDCYGRGYRMDFWHFQLILSCVLPYMLMLLLASSPLNEIVVGSDFYGVVAATPAVFVRAMIGFFAFYAGGYAWNLYLGVGLRRTVARMLDVVPGWSMMVMSSRELLIFLSGVCLSGQIILLSFYFSSQGFGFNLRAYTFENPGIRPFAQMISLTSTIVAAYCVARYLETKEKSILLSGSLLFVGLLFFGQRGNLLGIFIGGGLCYVLLRRDSISLTRVVFVAGSSILLIAYLGSVREGTYSPAAFLTSLVFLIFFGNNLCDLRDFAWMYSHWDHQLWLGRTYIAGLMTFVPRSASGFREIWTFGVATARTVGLDAETHPGLKPGLFGEAYFNFGVVGVLVFGFLMGMIIRRIDIGAKAALRSDRPSIMRAFAYATLLYFASCLNTSAAIPGLYAAVGLYLLAWLYLRARVLFLHPSAVPTQRASS